MVPLGGAVGRPIVVAADQLIDTTGNGQEVIQKDAEFANGV